MDRLPTLIVLIYSLVSRHLFNDGQRTPLGRVLLEKLIFPKLFKEFTVLWNLNILYLVHKEPPLVHFLCQMNPINTLPCSFMLELNFLSHLRLGFQVVFFCFKFSHQNPVCISVTYVPHIQPISFSLIWAPLWYLMITINSVMKLHCTVFVSSSLTEVIYFQVRWDGSSALCIIISEFAWSDFGNKTREWSILLTGYEPDASLNHFIYVRMEGWGLSVFNAMKLYGKWRCFIHHMNQTLPSRGVQEDCTGMSDIVYYDYLLGVYLYCICLWNSTPSTILGHRCIRLPNSLGFQQQVYPY